MYLFIYDEGEEGGLIEASETRRWQVHNSITTAGGSQQVEEKGGREGRIIII